MNKPANWDNVEAQGYGDDYKRLAPGGYVAKIISAEDVPDKEYIRIEFDITEGEYKSYGAACLERNGFNPLKTIRSYKEKAVGMFKGFIKCIEENNPNNFKWDWNVQSLVGKYFGVVMREEEYRKQDGTIGTRMGVARTIALGDARTGKYKVPEKKTLPVEQNTAPAFAPADDVELPWN